MGGGGKGGGGGGGSVQVTTYSISADYLLGFNTIGRIGTIWSNKDQYPALLSNQVFSFTGTSYSNTLSGLPGALIAIVAIEVSVPVSGSFNDYGGPGVIAFSGNLVQPLYNDPRHGTGVSGSNYFPNGDLATNTSQQYFTVAYGENVGHWNTQTGFQSPGGGNLANFSIEMNQSGSGTYTVTVWYIYAGTLGKPLSKLNMTFESLLGNGGYNPLTYPELAGIMAPNIDMGMAAQLPQYSFETYGLFGYTRNGDCNPADVIIDIICSGSNSQLPNQSWNHGAELGSGSLRGSILFEPTDLTTPNNTNIVPFIQNGMAKGLGLSQVRAYCESFGVFVSGALEQQRPAADWLADLLDCANAVAVWNGQSLKILPRCEVSNFGVNGIYVAPTAAGPLADLNDSHFVVSGSTSPITIVRSRPSDATNILPIEHLQRNNQYNPNVTTICDASSIVKWGPNKANPKQLHWIHDAATAFKVGYPMLKRMTLVQSKTYKFKLPASFELFDPWDLVTITDPVLGLNKTPVRFGRMSEDNGTIDCEAEPFIYGAHWTPTQVQIVSPPGAPSLSQQAGGSLGATTYFVEITYTNGTGETTGSIESSLAVSANNVLVVTAPAAMGYATGYNVYVATSTGAETKQNTLPIAFGVNWVEPNTGLISGAALPVTNTLFVSPAGVSSFSSNLAQDPGDVNTPVFFEPTTRLANLQAASYQIWIGLSGANTNFGGCGVYMSTDGTNYNFVGTFFGQSTMGVVYSANYPSATDPDATNNLWVDLTQSLNTLPSFTTAQRDNFASISYLAGGGAVGALTVPYEVVCFATATLQATSQYKLTPTTRRAQYGTPSAVHNIGTPFIFLGTGAGPVFKMSYDPVLVGKTLHFKFTSFNLTGSIQHLLSAVADYTFSPTGLTGSGTGNAVYNISPNQPVFQGKAGGWPGHAGYTNLTSIYAAAFSALFPSGTVSYNERSPALTSVGPLPAPSTPSLSQTASGALAATTYFVKITYTNAFGETVGSTEASLAVLINNVLVVTSPAASGNATGWNVYVSTTTGTETKQNGGTPLTLGVNWQEPNTGLVAGGALPGTNTASQVYWVTIGDSGYIGETAGINTLTMYVETNSTKANTPGYTYLGKIQIDNTSPGGNQGQGGGSAGPR